MNRYKVYYSGRSSAVINARTANGARLQAWKLLREFKYGWRKSDFIRNATVKRI